MRKQKKQLLMAMLCMFSMLSNSAAVVAHSDGTVPAGRQGTSVQLTLPAPTGPYAIGTVSVHLVDHDRQDPYWSSPHSRELMVSLWYPTRVNRDLERSNGRANRAPWMPSGALEKFRPELADLYSRLLSPPDAPPPQPPPPGSSASGLSPKASDTNPSNPISLDGVSFPITHAMQSAPVGMSDRRYPVVLFSPGYGMNREQGTALVEDLASHGYVVVTISHTYDSGEVEFPGKRIELGRHDLDNSGHVAVVIRRDDTKFVLDKLQDLAAGMNPDAEHRELPDELGSSLDLSKIGMFGHSLGGATAVQTMANDHRVIAGMDLDGTVFPDIDPLSSPREELNAAMALLASRISDRPFMFMTSGGLAGTSPDMFFGPFVGSFWNNMSGWRRFVSFIGTSHFSYTDNDLLIEQCIEAGIVPPSLAENFRVIDQDRAVAVERAYIRAFFDRWLRDRGTQLLDGPAPEFPEIIFY